MEHEFRKIRKIKWTNCRKKVNSLFPTCLPEDIKEEKIEIINDLIYVIKKWFIFFLNHPWRVFLQISTNLMNFSRISVQNIMQKYSP